MKTVACLAFLAVPLLAAPVQISITPKPSHDVPRSLHGLFFEDINYGADGGLYAELVQNRSFEHAESLYAWSPVSRNAQGTLSVSDDKPCHPQNPHFARLDVKVPGEGFGISNEGWDGIVLDPGANYFVSLFARHAAGKGKLIVRLVDETGSPLAESSIPALGKDWKRYELTLKSSRKADHAKLEVLSAAPGITDLDVISLFPENTWNHRKNGLRQDLVKVLKDMKPGFLRFPGGCIVEGRTLDNAYRWKETIGDIAARKQNKNRWMDAVNLKAPQYYQSYGLGFFEYFLLCEDIGAEPLPILNCGMSCQFQNAEKVPVGQLQPYIQDALDLIEFANGPTTSQWGAKRAAMGHPAPFHLKLLGVGNEQWGPEYLERYKPFQAALKSKYPDVQLVMATGPRVDDGHWKLIMDQTRKGLPADILDEHYYCPPDWFLANADRYDRYDRKGPKIFAGEFAAHVAGLKSSLQAAIAEAALMTGILRDSDVVSMASYAPLFAKKDHTQWTPDLIFFDNRRVCLTPSYHVQALFSQNRPDAILPVTLAGNNPAADASAAKGATKRLYVTAGIDRASREIILFVVNPGNQAEEASISLNSGSFAKGTGTRIVLASNSPDAVNTLDSPDAVKPRSEEFPVDGGAITTSFAADSLTILRVK